MNELELMLSGKLYKATSPELKELFLKKVDFLDKFNNTSFGDYKTREELCRSIFKKIGANFTINKPLYVDYGSNISIGDNFYANADCLFLDVNNITIGNNVLLAPRVSIYTAGHPIDKDIRNEGLEYGYPVVIGDDVWIGGGVTINPGVTIGSNVVIGSGSVVTKDIPSNVVACGNPCKVIREISKKDKEYWQKQKEEYYSLFEK